MGLFSRATPILEALARLRALRLRQDATRDLAEALSAAEGEPSGGPSEAARALSAALHRAKKCGAADSSVARSAAERLLILQTVVDTLASAEALLREIELGSGPGAIEPAEEAARALASSGFAALARARPDTNVNAKEFRNPLTFETGGGSPGEARPGARMAFRGCESQVTAARSGGSVPQLREAVRALEALNTGASGSSSSARQAQLRDARAALKRVSQAARARVGAALREGTEEAAGAALAEAIAAGDAELRRECEARLKGLKLQARPSSCTAIMLFAHAPSSLTALVAKESPEWEEAMACRAERAVLVSGAKAEAVSLALRRSDCGAELEAVIPAAAGAGGPPRALAVFASAEAARAAAALLPASLPCTAPPAVPRSAGAGPAASSKAKAERKAKGRMSLREFLARPEAKAAAEEEAPEIRVDATEAPPAARGSWAAAAGAGANAGVPPRGRRGRRAPNRAQGEPKPPGSVAAAGEFEAAAAAAGGDAHAEAALLVALRRW
eukprot:tig00021254_g19692.t1